MPKKKKEKPEIKKKKSALDIALSKIEKQFGKGAIIKLDSNFKAEVNSIPTGSLSLDLAIGIGGLPRGRVIEVYGTESSGKTTLCLSAVAQVQQLKEKAAYIDVEHSFNPDWATKNGINLQDLLFSQPESGEEALTIAQTLIESNEVALIIVDSVASLVPKAELEGEMTDTQIGLQARLMSKAMRKLTAAINKSNTCVIFINQIREKIGVRFGSPETTPGGRALKFYASVRIDLRRKGILKKGEDCIGTQVKANVKKNKVASPFKIAEFFIYNDEGVSYVGEIVYLAIKHGIIGKAGSWFSFNEENLAQGQEGTRQYLKENPEVLKKIEEQVFNLLGLGKEKDEKKQ